MDRFGIPEIHSAIPGDHARTSSAAEMLASVLSSSVAPPRILDLGCGDGRAVDLVRMLAPSAEYRGVDIESSPEVDSRQREDANFHTFDGISLPFEDCCFDIVFTQQVFEHVRYPDLLISEVLRVLRPGGWFVGSLSGLEPYHSRSIFNLTPYGLVKLLIDNGFEKAEVRPGVDGVSLIIRQLTARAFARISLAYWLCGLLALAKRLDPRSHNALKLRFAGHICFKAQKPAKG